MSGYIPIDELPSTEQLDKAHADKKAEWAERAEAEEKVLGTDEEITKNLKDVRKEMRRMGHDTPGWE